MMVDSQQIGRLLSIHHLTMGTAESCTGGNIAHQITRIPGSSAYFKGAIVSYCNEVKHQLLGVKEDDLKMFGAVSRPVVEQMASGAIRTLKCDCAVATSGIAGPGGGTSQKPVGTVWIAAAFRENVLSGCYHFGSDREENISCATAAAIRLLEELLYSVGLREPV